MFVGHFSAPCPHGMIDAGRRSGRAAQWDAAGTGRPRKGQQMKRTLPTFAVVAGLTAAAFVATPVSAAPSRTTLTLACDRGTSALAFVVLHPASGGDLSVDLACTSGSRRDREVDLRPYESVDVTSFSVDSSAGQTTCEGSSANPLPFVQHCGPKQGGARLTVR